MQSQLLKRSRILADQFLQFVNLSKSPFHVVQWCRQKLNQNGYTQLSQTSNWKIQKGNKYFFTRNNSTMIAFHIGQKFQPSNTGFKIIGAHTDSPCLKIAPVSKQKFKTYAQTHVMTYGGGLWHTWFDRDLVLAGKVLYEEEVKQGQEQRYSSKLWQSKRPLLKIPNLAIHLRGAQRNKFQPNTETQLRAILSSQIHQNLIDFKQKVKQSQIFSKHNRGLINIISKQTGIKPEKIIDFDLYFADHNPSSYFGLNEDFISSPRIDNLFSCFHALMALIQNQNDGSYINMAALFDHEQCGSDSAQGAGSPIVIQSIKRLYKLLCVTQQNDNFQKLMQKSFLISADMAHSVHPNYQSKHQSNHQVEMNKGVVLKINYNQRYASDLVSTSLFKILAKKVGVPLQQIIVRNDSPCGSTIGPIMAAGTGIKTIDVGCASLGMHSIRQTCGIIDGTYYRDIFSSFYKNYENIKHDLLDH